MGFARAVKRRARAAVAPSVFLLLTGYFLYNAVEGDRGLRAYAQLRQDMDAARADRDRADVELAAWERRVNSLRNNRLDQDALDERARAILNLADPADVVVPLKRGERTF